MPANLISIYLEAERGFKSVKTLECIAPYILKRGSHLIELAAHVHQNFLVQLKYARIWREGRFDGQMVNRDHVLED